MKQVEFRMERPGLVTLGERIQVSESRLSTIQGTMYYYILEPKAAMSDNVPARNRLNLLEGKVIEITPQEGGSFYKVVCEFED